MERVGLEGLTVILPGGPIEHPGTGDVHGDGDGHDQESPEAGVDLPGMDQEAPDGLINDPGAGDEQEDGLDEGREVLDLAVAVGVFVVGRLVGEMDGEERDDGRDEVERGVGRLGQDAEAPRRQADDELHPRQKDRRDDGVRRRRLLFLLAGQSLQRFVRRHGPSLPGESPFILAWGFRQYKERGPASRPGGLVIGGSRAGEKSL